MSRLRSRMSRRGKSSNTKRNKMNKSSRKRKTRSNKIENYVKPSNKRYSKQRRCKTRCSRKPYSKRRKSRHFWDSLSLKKFKNFKLKFNKKNRKKLIKGWRKSNLQNRSLLKISWRKRRGWPRRNSDKTKRWKISRRGTSSKMLRIGRELLILKHEVRRSKMRWIEWRKELWRRTMPPRSSKNCSSSRML